MTRREFPATLLAAAAAPRARFRKSICSIVFPSGMPAAERFRQTRDAGFEGIEIRMGEEVKLSFTPDEVKRVGDDARRAGVAISALWASEGLPGHPLNDPSPEVRAKGVADIVKTIEAAALLGCGAILVVPGRLGSGSRFVTGYEETWKLFTAELKKTLPAAARAKVVVGPENVWNKFLVSPLEMRSFVDQFSSPWLQAFFDIGNVMQFGYPQDWILTLGRRLRNIHLKDYKLSTRAEQGRFVNLMEGDVDWKENMAALVRVGYQGFIGPEYSPDAADSGQLRKLSEVTDRILALA